MYSYLTLLVLGLALELVGDDDKSTILNTARLECLTNQELRGWVEGVRC
jgi:hypothetical protein